MRPSALLPKLALTAVALTVSAQIAAAAGALAVGACTRHGFSYDFATQAVANERALNECAENGDRTCEVVVTFRGTCAALAVGANCSGKGWAWAYSRPQAEGIALAYCRQIGGQNCSVIRWVCDARG